jgi:hypothetical protein
LLEKAVIAATNQCFNKTKYHRNLEKILAIEFITREPFFDE